MSHKTRTLALPRVSLFLVVVTAVLATVLFSGCITAVAPESENTKSTSMEKDNSMMNDEENMEKDLDDAMDAVMEKDDAMKKEDAMMENEDAMMEKDAMEKDDAMMEDKAMEAKGEYLTYDPSGSQLAMANSGDVVLFFNASWCPDCRATEADINANLANIPANTYILKVDYDTYTDLKNKYGVTYQHTFVQVDANGNQIKKWNGSPTLAALVSQIQ